jgi:aminoglycoside 3-N-acetyltransferase
MNETAQRFLLNEWISCGIAYGDTVLLHSNLVALLRGFRRKGIALSVGEILTSLLAAVGARGTVLLPLFNFGFAHGQAFDIKSTPSEMGALSEAGRSHPDAVRTGHPIYSFAAIGAGAWRFEGLENFSGYGADSPFGVLRDMNGKIAVLNLHDQGSMTFYHHVEEMLGVTYRYHKTFSGTYVNKAGRASGRKFGLFVRDTTRGVETDVNEMGERLWRLGLYSGCRPGVGFGCRTISANALFDATADVIRGGQAEGLLYRIGKVNS